MNPLRAFCTFWLPSDGIKELIRQQAIAIELKILDAELAEREARFLTRRLRAQHAYLLAELEGKGVDNGPPGGDNGPIPPGDRFPSIPGPHVNSKPFSWSPDVPTP